MKLNHIISALALMASAMNSIAAPLHLAVPGSKEYDNVGAGVISGQTFIAEAGLLTGVIWYIGDPERMNVPSVNGLSGTASLVLYGAADLSNPVEISRQSFVGAGDNVFGLTRFDFSSPVSTVIGQTYFISIDTLDGFGIGLRSLDASTYEGGAQAVLTTSGVTLNASGRDTSFEISAVPEPATISLMLAGIGLIAYRRASGGQRRGA